MTVQWLRKVTTVRHGGRLEDDSSGGESVYQCCAPKGLVWSCDTLHMLKVQWSTQSEQSFAIRDAIERMSYGVQPCDVTDCEICSPQGEDDVSD
jgi:hypothetical protein